MRIVSPYKPYPVDALNYHHTPDRIGEFDWMEALRMLAISAESFGYQVVALSDTELPVPHIQLATRHQNLMTWILEVSLAYIESAHFDQDSVFISPDSLINGPFPDLKGADLGICARFAPKYQKKPILNSFQMWSVASKPKLVRFYRECLRIAEELDSEWGGDTLPLTQLLSPVVPGLTQRHGLLVRFFSHADILRTINESDVAALASGNPPMQRFCTLIDFKGSRKLHMVNYYKAIYENR